MYSSAGVDLIQKTPRRAGVLDCLRQGCPLSDLLTATGGLAYDGQTRVSLGVARQLSEIVGIAGDDDSVFRDCISQHRAIRCSAQSSFIDMHCVVPVHVPEMRGQHRREILVDQEAWRHVFPAGLPRDGLAAA